MKTGELHPPISITGMPGKGEGQPANSVLSHDCSKSMIGYSPADVLKLADPSTDFGDASRVSAKGLTRAMVLHPIATGLNFIAFLMAIGAGVIGSLLASVVALLAFIVTLIAMIIDFVLFSIVRSHVNDSSSGAEASYSTAAWTILASAICSLLGTVVVFLTCCSTRMHRRHESKPVGTRRRWF